MKLTNEQLNQLRHDITNLSNVFNNIETISPSRLIDTLNTTCNSLLQILKEIEPTIETVEPIVSIESNYLTYDVFIAKLVYARKDIQLIWYNIVHLNKHDEIACRNIYNYNIKFINEKIVPNL